MDWWRRVTVVHFHIALVHVDSGGVSYYRLGNPRLKSIISFLTDPRVLRLLTSSRSEVICELHDVSPSPGGNICFQLSPSQWGGSLHLLVCSHAFLIDEFHSLVPFLNFHRNAGSTATQINELNDPACSFQAKLNKRGKNANQSGSCDKRVRTK